MTPDLDQLVREVTELTGSAKPAWLEEGAPLLSDTATTGGEDETFYLIGIIGGKDVGKSALVNALVGHAITAQTSHGPGTETVIAYAHERQVNPLQELLDRAVPGRYSIVTHTIPRLFRQVLLDLPDIDSHYTDHLDVTRRMLRHMLFPIWVQSVEKYADRQPQQMLAKVAAGNSPANFVFCLNKVDQVDGSGNTNGVAASGAVRELQDDFAQRLARTLQLPAPPRVWAISAIRPERYELPPLRDLLAQQKSAESIRDSKQKAALRQRSSVLQWLNGQDLGGRAARLQRLQDEADEYVTERIGGPLLEGVVPRLLDDPAHRQAVVDDCMQKRVGRWPIVGVLHTLYSAIGTFFRRNAENRQRPPGARTGEVLVDQHLLGLWGAIPGPAGEPAANVRVGESLATMIQTSFAQLQQSHPAMGPLYQQRKLWESMPASVAAGQLREAMVATVDRQRQVAGGRACGKDNSVAAFVRGVLTIGAILWFPVVQPVLKAVLASRPTTQSAGGQSPGLLLVFIDLLSIQYLINMLTGLLLYFSVIWLFLRWDTQRRVNRQFARWKRLEGLDPTLSLTGRALDWINGLLEPIRSEKERFDAVAEKVEALRKSVG